MKSKLILTLALCCTSLTAAAQSKPAQAPATQPVFVVTQEDVPASAVKINVPTMPEAEPAKPVKEVTAKDVWSGPVGVHGIPLLLIMSMPVIASMYFAYQLFLFFRNRRRKLAIRHQER